MSAPYDGADVYRIVREGDRATVLHYPTERATVPCCPPLVVEAPDRDWDAAMRRAYLQTEARHGRAEGGEE